MDRRVVGAVVLTAVAIGLLLGAGVLFLVYSGEYNVAASKPHYRLVEWALATTMRRSVQDHAEGIEVPQLADTSLVRAGFRHFGAMCVTCHGAPGVERSEIGKGLLPEPPSLSREVPEWTPPQLFWIVKHGIKMSGMPAFGRTHDDRALWGIVAFLQRLPQVDSAEYAALQQQWGGQHGHGDGAGTGAQGHGGAAQGAGSGRADPGSSQQDAHSHQR